jgi:predicted permease
MTGLIQDFRYAVRQLRKSPGFTAVAVLTLALGIGANTGIFTLVNAVLLKSLPVPNPEQLFLVRQRDRFAEQTRVSYPLYERMLKVMPVSSSLAAMTRPGDFYLRAGSSQPEMTKGQLVSGNYFQTFETYPILGRLLTPEDNRSIDGHPVAVISYGCWKRHFAADLDVIGRQLTINGVRFTVVGVAAAEFFGAEPGRAPDFWLPLMMQSSLHFAQHYSKSTTADAEKPWVLQENITWLDLIVRASKRADLPQISGVLNQLFSRNLERNGMRTSPIQGQQARLENQLELEPGNQGTKALQRQFSQPLLVLAGMVGLVLLIACANLASLLLARAATRAREIAVRLSIGATRNRLIRQLLTECLLLSIVGGLLGIVVAYWCDAVLPKWASGGALPVPLNLTPDMRVLLFSIFIVLATGILFGLAPALQATSIEPVRALKANASWASSTQHPGAHWSLRQTLVAAQFALSLVLLVGAGLFIRTLRNFVSLNPGFDRNHLLTVWLDTNIRHYSHDQLLSFYQQVPDRMHSLPGVRSASLATCGLASSCRSASDIYLPGNSELAATPQTNIVSLHYFENVGMPLQRGRDFTQADNEKAPHTAIINQSLANKVFAGVDAIGHHFGYDSGSANEFQIVGVVADAQVNGVREAAPPMIYFPLLQSVTHVESLDVRAAGDPGSLTEQVRQALTSIDPDLPIGEITTMAEQVNSNLGQQRLIARLTAMFGALALGLACLGLYGVMSYMVARRTSELGIRLALGSSRNAVLWLVSQQTLVVIGAGIVAGLLLSLLAARTVTSLLFGLSPYDSATMLGAAGVLVLVSVASGLRPAWCAAHVNPMEALRVE